LKVTLPVEAGRGKVKRFWRAGACWAARKRSWRRAGAASAVVVKRVRGRRSILEVLGILRTEDIKSLVNVM
jgi:hypothetical protein